MKRVMILLAAALIGGCDEKGPSGTSGGAKAESQAGGTAAKPASVGATASPEREAPHLPVDPTNIVSIAAGSKDHTTLVVALKAAEYVDSVANPGPLTVFAPTNAAFEKLPAGTVEGLVKPDKQADLREILKYHVAVSTYRTKDFHDGEILAMANGAKTTIHVKDGKVSINNANIIASIPASNGIVHVIDAVLLPPAK